MSITHAQEYDIKKSFFTNLRREYVGKHYYLRDDKVFSIGNAISFAAMKTVRDHIEKDLIALGCSSGKFHISVTDGESISAYFTDAGQQDGPFVFQNTLTWKDALAYNHIRNYPDQPLIWDRAWVATQCRISYKELIGTADGLGLGINPVHAEMDPAFDDGKYFRSFIMRARNLWFFPELEMTEREGLYSFIPVAPTTSGGTLVNHAVWNTNKENYPKVQALLKLGAMK